MLSIEESYVKTNGYRTKILRSGSGPILMLLHGSGPGVSARANWEALIPEFAKDYTVIAPDSVGFGDTERPDDIVYGVETWANQAVGVLDTLGADRCFLIGNSLGGRVAMEIALRWPERVQAMVLMGSGGVKGPVSQGLSALRSYEPGVDNMRRLMVDYFAYDSSIVSDELVRLRHASSIADGAFDVYRSMFFDNRHKGNDLSISEDDAAAIKTPSLVAHGRDDLIIPVDNAFKLSAMLPHAELHVFPECGHWVQIEARHRFYDATMSFLRSRSVPEG